MKRDITGERIVKLRELGVDHLPSFMNKRNTKV